MANSLNKFLEVFKTKLVSAVADQIYIDAEDYVAESANAVHNTEEMPVLGERNEDTHDL